MHRMAKKPYITVESLTVGYGKELVFRDVSFNLSGPGLVMVLGPNGSGKTTLFKSILGLIPPLKGRVIVNGLEVTGKPELAGRLIGYVPQIPRVNTSFPISVREIVESAVVLRRPPPRLLTPSRVREMVDKILKQLGLEGVADKPLRSLSGGQRQRAFLARALVWNPSILIMDEPLSAIDPRGKEEMVSFIAKISEERVTVVSSHDPGLFLPYIKILVLVNRGVVAVGPPKETLRIEVLRRVYGGGVTLIDRCVHVVDSHVH